MNLIKFPAGFLWGTATSAHQVEGNNKNSDWWRWEKSHKRVENSGIACDHYNRYKQDFKLAKEVLHNNAHRLSIEWARIEPEEGKFDQKEIEHYRDVLLELRKLSVKTMVTLHHFSNPLWFAKMGGWEKQKNLKYFTRYATLCSEEFKDLVDYWIVINEPNVYVNMTYLQGQWTVQGKNLLATVRVFLNMAKAHALVYKIIHKIIPSALVSSTISYVYLKGSNIFTKAFVPLGHLISNYSLPLFAGKTFDFMAINYYMMHVLKLRDVNLSHLVHENLKIIKRTDNSDLDWPIYPRGLYELVIQTWKRYKLPIIITENGIADAKDTKRGKFIINHLAWLHQAIEEGVDVRGYFHWSLMDNFEWSIGRAARFGLLEMNYKTLERHPRSSALLYGRIAKYNQIRE